MKLSQLLRVGCTRKTTIAERAGLKAANSTQERQTRELTLSRVRRVHVDVLALGAEELDGFHLRLVSHPKRHHRLPSTQKVWAVAEFLHVMIRQVGAIRRPWWVEFWEKSMPRLYTSHPQHDWSTTGRRSSW